MTQPKRTTVLVDAELHDLAKQERVSMSETLNAGLRIRLGTRTLEEHS